MDTPDKTLEKLWMDYTKALPPDAGPVQLIETKKAFYAGAYSILATMVDQVGDEEEEVTEKDMDMVSGIFEEAEVFLASQIKGASA